MEVQAPCSSFHLKLDFHSPSHLQLVPKATSADPSVYLQEIRFKPSQISVFLAQCLRGLCAWRYAHFPETFQEEMERKT